MPENNSKFPITILIVTHNKPAYIEKMVYAIRKNTRHPYKVWICDNNSDRHTKKLIKSLNVDRVFFNKTNRWIEGVNIAMPHVEGELLCLSDQDITVPNLDGECWLTRLVGYMSKYASIGKLGFHISMENYNAEIGAQCGWPMSTVKAFEKRFIPGTNNELVYASVDLTMFIMRRDLFIDYNGKYPIFTYNHQFRYHPKYVCARTMPPLTAINLSYDDWKDTSDANVAYMTEMILIYSSANIPKLRYIIEQRKAILGTIRNIKTYFIILVTCFKNFKSTLKKIKTTVKRLKKCNFN